MAYQDEYTKMQLRIPTELHAQIKASAEKSGKSMNAELIARLQKSLEFPEIAAEATEQITNTVALLEQVRAMLDRSERRAHSQELLIQMLAATLNGVIQKDSAQAKGIALFDEFTKALSDGRFSDAAAPWVALQETLSEPKK
jgi:hypothetical protein